MPHHAAPATLAAHVPAVDAPRELQKATLPQYVIEPPDVLDITAVHVVPKAPYHLRTLDALAIHVLGTLPDAPIAGVYPVELGGLVQLGPAYGSVKVDDLTVEQAEEKIAAHLKRSLRAPEVSVTLADIAAVQPIAGPHLVGPDGRVNLGTYGGVNVTGLTVPEARAAIEAQLSRFLDDPKVAVRVTGYNSKSYYIITQGAGLGDSVARFPVTGNETVLDAISNIGGFTVQSSHKIWIARPGRNARGRDQILPVDWRSLSRVGEAETNYQLMPGDRLYIAENKWVALDNKMAILAAPIERAAGFAQLMASTVSRFSGNVLAGGAANRFGSGVVPVFVAP
jgi:polysaccharide export outer membrane protein